MRDERQRQNFLEYNHNHDAKGEFASDGSGGNQKLRDLIKAMKIGDVITFKRKEHGHRRPRSSNYDYIGMERAQ